MAKDTSVYQGIPADIKAKSFIHALSEIEQFSAIEYRTDLPEGVIPMLPRFTFWDVAIKTALVTTAYTFLMAPFCMAVFDKILPVFGQEDPSLMDRVFSWLLSAAPALGMSILIVVVLSTRVYMGRSTRNIVEGFLLSFVGGKLAASFLFGMFLMYFYDRLFTDDWIISFYTDLTQGELFTYRTKLAIRELFDWLLDFRRILPKAVGFSIMLHGGASLTVFISYLYCRWKSDRLKEFRQEWE